MTKPNISVQWTEVTPKMAEEWLLKNASNRSLRRHTIEAYADDMLAGKWMATHQGIAFDEHGNLLDGQHRLSAIVKAGVTVGMMVTRGLPVHQKESATMDAVDGGAARTVADRLKLAHGVKCAALTAAISTAIGGICCKAPVRKVTVAQTLRVIGAYGDEMAYVINNAAKMNTLRRATVMAGIAFSLPTHRALVENFYSRLKSGAGLGERSPILHLRNYLMSDEAFMHARGDRRDRVKVTEMTLHAMAMHVRGESCAKLVHCDKGAAFFCELQKDRVKEISGVFRFVAPVQP